MPTAISAKTWPGPETAMITPAPAVATSTLLFSTQLETTLVAVSSCAVCASAGVSAACVGRVMVTAVAAAAAHTYASGGAAPGEDHRRGRTHRDRLGDVSGGEHAHRWVAVGHDRCERCKQHRRHQLEHRHQAGGGGAALVVCVHQHRQPHRVFGSVEREKGQQHPPQVAVSQHG